MPVIGEHVTPGWNELLCSLSTDVNPHRGDTYLEIPSMRLNGRSEAKRDCAGYDRIGMIDCPPNAPDSAQSGGCARSSH